MKEKKKKQKKRKRNKEESFCFFSLALSLSLSLSLSLVPSFESRLSSGCKSQTQQTKYFLFLLLPLFLLPLLFASPALPQEFRQLEDAWHQVRQRQREMDEMLQQAFQKGVAKGQQQQFHAARQQAHDANMQWLTKLDEKNRAVEQKLSTEFNQLASNLETRFQVACSDIKCQQQQQAVVDCYRANPRTTLNCSRVVADFLSCAEQARQVCQR